MSNDFDKVLDMMREVVRKKNQSVSNLTDIEKILTKLVNEFEYGYAFTKNCRDLLEKLTEFKTSDKINVTLVIERRKGS